MRPASPTTSGRADFAALAFALTFPTLTTWLYFVVLAPAAGAPDPTDANPLMKIAYGAGKVAQFAFPVVWWALTDPTRLRPARPSWRGLGPALAFGLAVGGAIVGLYFGALRGGPLLAGVGDQVRAKVGGFGLATPAGFLALAAFYTVAHSLLEEYYWRGFVFGGLSRLVPPTPAVVVSSLGFMSHHVVLLAVYLPGRWELIVPFSLAVAGGGAAWALLYRRGGSVYPAWLSHALVDAALMAVGYDLAFGRPGHP
jgi:CAAX protease family protein